MKYREWSQDDINKILDMRKQNYSWSDIGVKLGDSSENVRAAFRRSIGAKHSAYIDKEQKHEPLPVPVVAVIDIETIPGISYFWNMFDELNNIEMVITSPCMVSWAGKYLNNSEIHSDILTPRESMGRDTGRISRSLWNFLSIANAVVGHNFLGFDLKFINTEFMKNGMVPLKYPVIDTLQIAKQNFRFASNKMKFINSELGIRNKIETEGFPLWSACSEGDVNALKTMLEYNIGDIAATEDLFYRFRPFVKNFNMGVFNESEVYQCPACGSDRLSHGQVQWPTPAGLWEQARCDDCGCLFRLKVNSLTTNKKKHLGINS